MTQDDISFTDLIASSIHDMKSSLNVQVSALEKIASLLIGLMNKEGKSDALARMAGGKYCQTWRRTLTIVNAPAGQTGNTRPAAKGRRDVGVGKCGVTRRVFETARARSDGLFCAVGLAWVRRPWQGRSAARAPRLPTPALVVLCRKR